MTIETKQFSNWAWWQIVDDNWADLENLIKSFHPAYNKSSYYPITAAKAESACKKIREEIKDKFPKDRSPLDLARVAKTTRNIEEMDKLLNDVWFGMPESANVRSFPGFFVLCDLCADSPLLND